MLQGAAETPLTADDVPELPPKLHANHFRDRVLAELEDGPVSIGAICWRLCWREVAIGLITSVTHGVIVSLVRPILLRYIIEKAAARSFARRAHGELWW